MFFLLILVQYHKLIHLQPLNLSSSSFPNSTTTTTTINNNKNSILPVKTSNSIIQATSFTETTIFSTETKTKEISSATTTANSTEAMVVSSTLPKDFQINFDLYKFPKMQSPKKTLTIKK